MLENLIEKLLTDPSIGENIVSQKHFPAGNGKMFDLPPYLDQSLIRALHQTGITKLYPHQLKAIQAINSGKHTLVVSGVASGKSLIYQIPILDALLKHPQMTAMLIFPTKALSYDQGEKLKALISHIPQVTEKKQILVAYFDGDTPQSQRSKVIQQCQILFTNPDMLHSSILPRHSKWMRFFSNLKLVVIDEIHVYRGVFGSHVANILRRLKRIAHYHGSAPLFVLTSGTIGAPEELASNLIEEPVEKIVQKDSLRAARHILLYNPPLINKEFGFRRHPFEDALRIVSESLQRGLHSIIFCRSRKAVELLQLRLREECSANAHELDHTIRSYRSGYLPNLRREIEQGLRSGTIMAVVATNALELGIDIGNLELTIIIGFPGSIASTWQQFGRSGRTRQLSLGILILSDDPLDQFIAHQPNYFWEANPERAIIDPNNPLILLAHLRCALAEIPLSKPQPVFGKAPIEVLSALLESLVSQGEAITGKNHYFYNGLYSPHSFSIRSISNHQFQLFLNNEKERILLGYVDSESADWMVHPGAIYFHDGKAYLVESLDYERRIATLQESSTDVITQPIVQVEVMNLQSLQSQSLRSSSGSQYQIAFGRIEITRRVEGFEEIDFKKRVVRERKTLDLPSHQLVTNSFWLTLSKEFVENLREQGKWTNDPNRYGPNWENQKRLARQRDRFLCQMCGIPESSEAHHVHHKIPFRLFSSDLEANALDNLITLCSSCHRKVEQSVRVQSGLAALGYALGHVSPLYAMCDRQDLGVITEPSFRWCDGLPTILIHEHIPGGIGLTYRLYEVALQLLATIHHHIRSCPCLEGCPSCTGPTAIQGRGGKSEALEILDRMLG